MTRDELLYKICPTDTTFDCRTGNKSCNCYDCGRVLEEWLNEYDKHVIEQYKADTNLKDTIREIHDNVAREMYCKGIDDFVHKIKERQYVLHILSDFMNCEDYGMFTVGIEEIAEELKAGGNNENYNKEES